MEPRIDEYARNEIYHLDWVELVDILDDTNFGAEIARELTEQGHDDEPAHDEMWDWGDWIAESERQFLAELCRWMPVAEIDPNNDVGRAEAYARAEQWRSLPR